MSRMSKSVLNALDNAREKALEQDLLGVEIAHIDLCIKLINEAAEMLGEEIDRLPEMAVLLK